MLANRTHADGTTTQVHLGGWRRQAADARDARHQFKVPQGLLKLASSCDNRSICSTVEDQGQLGSCTANMFAGLVEANEVKAGRKAPAVMVAAAQVQVSNVTTSPSGVVTFTTTVTPPAAPAPAPAAKLVQVSRLFQYYATRKIEGTTSEDSGATIRDTIQAGVLYGVADESVYPYDINKFAQNPPAGVWSAAASHKVTSYHAIADGDLASMKAALASGTLVGFGFSVYDAFLSQTMAKQAMLCRPGASESLQGGHAVCLVGYDDNKVMPDGSKGAFLVRNSWGASWGLQGYFWMAYNYVSDANLASDFWVVQSSPV